MKIVYLLITLVYSITCRASIDVLIIYQSGDNDLYLSVDKFEKTISSHYPHANVVKSSTYKDINFVYESDTLIVCLIVHSNPFPKNVQRYGKLMIFLNNISGEVSEKHLYKDILPSNQLIKLLNNHHGRKLVIFEGCYPELAYSSINNCTWMFSCLADQVSIIHTNKGAAWIDYISNNIENGSESADLVNSVNNNLYNKKSFYNSQTHSDYIFVKNIPSSKNKIKSIHYGQIFIF